MNTKNASANHPLQSYEWGEFRKKTNVKVIREGFQITIHPMPHTPWTIGYFPKGDIPNEEMIGKLKEIGKEENCIFIQLEPNALVDNKKQMVNDRWKIVPSAHPLFTKYTFILDLTKSEDELLKNMHPKTRYNIKVAQKHGVEVIEDNSDAAFETYLNLTHETTKRQKFYAHDESYHRLMWQTLGIRNQELGIRNKKSHNSYSIIHNSNKLTAHLLIARYKDEPLVAWILFVYKDTIYYPYGASSSLHKETMASNLMMWEAIKFGKKRGLKKFDMWGALGPNPDKHDPWYGFHRFKEGYGPKHVEYIGSYDLIINPFLYDIYKIVDKLRWTILRLKHIIA